PVLAAHLDPAGRASGGEPVEDRLDLVGERVPGRAKAVGVEGVADVAELGLARAAGGAPDDLGVEALRAPAGVLVRLGPAQAVVDVQRGDAVAEIPERVVETGRVGAARDEALHLSTRLDELVPADVRLDPLQQLHGSIVPSEPRRPNLVRGSPS